MSFPLTPEGRLHALKELDILDTAPEAAFDKLTALTAQLFDVPIVLISFVESYRQWFKSHHGLNVCETSRDVSFCVHALSTNEIFVVPDASQDERFVNNTLVTGDPHIRFYAGAPLYTSEGQAVGTLCIIDRVPRSFSQTKQRLLQDLAALVVDELELRLSRQRLQRQEEHWQALIQGTSDLISVADMHGVILYNSPAVTPILGFLPQELVGKKLVDFVHPDEQEQAVEVLCAVAEDGEGETRAECRFRHKDNSWRDLEIIIQNRLRDESVRGLVLTSRDITEQKRTQERLRLLESVTVHTNDTVIITEADTINEPGPRIVYVNEAFTRMTGYSSEEVLGKSPRMLQGPQTQRSSLDKLRRALETHLPEKVQLLNYKKNGQIFWAEMAISPVIQEDGQISHWISIQRDVTENKEVEETLRRANEEVTRMNQALRESDEQLRLALEAGDMGTWERDYQTDEVIWSPQAERLYGVKPGEFDGTLEGVLERVHPDDQPILLHRISSPRPTNEFVDEFRVQCADGSTRWLESRGRVFKNNKGHNKSSAGIVLDVTTRKRDLEGAQLETLKRLALAAEYRDDDTGLHTQRVGRLSRMLAETLNLPQALVQLIGETAPLHDVGKIGVPDAILLKPGKLSDEEFAVIKRHTYIGAGILSGSTSPWLQMAEEIALTHHERWDGRGYMGLKGEEIPLVGSIVCIADVFDALTHQRPYKQAWPLEAAISEIRSQSGHQFNPRIVEAFLSLNHQDFL